MEVPVAAMRYIDFRAYRDALFETLGPNCPPLFVFAYLLCITMTVHILSQLPFRDAVKIVLMIAFTYYVRIYTSFDAQCIIPLLRRD